VTTGRALAPTATPTPYPTSSNRHVAVCGCMWLYVAEGPRRVARPVAVEARWTARRPQKL